MRLEKSYGLSAIRLKAIGHLETRCNRFEQLTIKLNWATLRKRPADQLNDFLFYLDNTLAGYLALYGFNKKEVEISAMVAPEFRRQGIFRRLLTAARQEVQRRDIPDLLFICERASKSGIATMQAIGADYNFSEYRMDLHHPPPPIPMTDKLQLRPARTEDIQLMARMDELCFQINVEQTMERIKQEINNPGRNMLMITFNNRSIGKIDILTSRAEIYISAFCILPEYRGKGYGKAVLAQVVTDLVAKGHKDIALEVETKNESALNLYKICGFQTTTAYDYYRLAA